MCSCCGDVTGERALRGGMASGGGVKIGISDAGRDCALLGLRFLANPAMSEVDCEAGLPRSEEKLASEKIEGIRRTGLLSILFVILAQKQAESIKLVAKIKLICSAAQSSRRKEYRIERDRLDLETLPFFSG